VTQLERRFPIDGLSEQDTDSLIEAYVQYSELLFRAKDDLDAELGYAVDDFVDEKEGQGGK